MASEHGRQRRSIITNTRFLGQEGAAYNAGRYTWMGQLGVTGFLMKNLDANP